MEQGFNRLNEGAMDFEALKRLQEAFDVESAPTADYAENTRQFELTPRMFTAMRLGIRPSKFVAWNKKVNKRRAKNKVAKASRKRNRVTA